LTENLQTLDGPSPCEKNLILPKPKIVINNKPPKEVDLSSFLKSVFSCCNPLLILPTLMGRKTYTASLKSGHHFTAEQMQQEME
jgi:hypothetical protein